MIGCIRASLALDCHGIVVMIDITVFPIGTSFKPVAGVHLHGRLGGLDSECAS